MRKKKNNSVSAIATFIFLPLLAALLFSMGVVRTACLSKGYELSTMSREIDKNKLEREVLLSQRSNLINKDNLFSAASQRGFIFKQEGRTYNVR